ncbi:MAG: hypothetical protein LBT16_14855, partial [Treponema sp.]|nr:hypothetical protein [Treponema sp.]
LTPKPGYTLDGIPANFFSYSGATTVTNSANSGVVTVTFPFTPFTTQWYVFATGSSDGNTGLTTAAPLATVDRALVRMRNEYSLATWPNKGLATEQEVYSDIKGTLNYISGFSNGMVSITGANAYPAIELRGLGAGTNAGVLDATGKRRVLYISDSNNRVTLRQYLTLKGGDADNGGGAYIGGGGALTLDGGETGTITGNTAANSGGGVYIAANAAFTLSAGTVSSNVATVGGGGGVHIGAATAAFTMHGGTITLNRAVWGGGVYNGGNFYLGAGTISANTVTSNGGGIYSGGTLTLSGGNVTSNTSSNTAGGGGGILVAGGTITMTGTTISTNKSMNGGGVYMNAGTFTMKGGTISGNTVTGSVYGSRGGGVAISGGSFIIESGNIYSNTAQAYGGGVYVEHGVSYPRAVFKMSKINITGTSHALANKAGQGPFNWTGAPTTISAADAGQALYIYAPLKKRNSTTALTDIVMYDSALSSDASPTTANYAGTTMVWE